MVSLFFITPLNHEILFFYFPLDSFIMLLHDLQYFYSYSQNVFTRILKFLIFLHFYRKKIKMASMQYLYSPRAVGLYLNVAGHHVCADRAGESGSATGAES